MYILPIGDTLNYAIIQLVLLIWLFSMYFIYVRNGFPQWIPILFIVSFVVYKWLMITTENCTSDENFQYYQRIIFYGLWVVLVSTGYYTLYRSLPEVEPGIRIGKEEIPERELTV